MSLIQIPALNALESYSNTKPIRNPSPMVGTSVVPAIGVPSTIKVTSLEGGKNVQFIKGASVGTDSDEFTDEQFDIVLAKSRSPLEAMAEEARKSLRERTARKFPA